MAILVKQYGDAVGPLGLPMASAVARELEKLLKSLPKECREFGLGHVGETKAIDFEDGEHADTSFVTTNALDRDREAVFARGGDWRQFLKNPVVTFAHNYEELPIGKAAWVKKANKGNNEGWLAKTIYKGRPETHPSAAEWFPDTVWSFVRDGFLPGKSIGFIPLNMRPPEEKEIKAQPELAKARAVIDKWLALEYAVTPVQSNPEALVQSTAKMKLKGVSCEKFFEAIGLMVPAELAPAPPPEEPKFEFKVYTPPPPLDVREEFRRRAAQEVGRIDVSRVLERALARTRGKIL